MTTKLDGNHVVAETFDVRVTRRGWALTAGVFFLVIVFGVIMHVTKEFNPFENVTTAYKNWQDQYKSDWMRRFFFSPLDFAVTPVGTYSISVAQALFWTFIVAFSCVYVYVLKAAFIVIPNQILMLMGISGGTALVSRINAVSKSTAIPKEIMKGVQRERIPRLRDMMSIGGRMNVYKFQMVVFTLITGIIVMVELIKACNFPEIPATLVTLMGVSNTLYMGNEVTLDPMKEVRDKMKVYKKEKNPVKRTELEKEIREMLIECYQTK